MKRSGLVFIIALLTPTIWSVPPNFHWAKEKLMSYKSSGAYALDLAKTDKQALQYLKNRVNRNKKTNKLAIMLDVDETALSNFTAIKTLYAAIGNVGDTLTAKQIQVMTDPFHDPAIAPTLNLYRYAIKHQVAVFFVTGRTSNDLKGTIANLHRVGYKQWQALILRQPAEYGLKADIYKRNKAKTIRQQGYDLVLAVGDQYSDLPRRYADVVFKLPNPFYFIP
jgi:predicted secreted acid phosphatase